MFTRKAPVPVRNPHPDPRVEVHLQQIIGLRESAERKAALSRQYANDVKIIQANYTYVTRAGYGSRVENIARQLKITQAEIRQLEQEILAIHDQISERTADLSDTDLSYL